MRSILRRGRDWEVTSLPSESLISAIQTSLSCATPFAVLLAQRGGADWNALIDPSMQSLHSPFLLEGMTEALDRLQKAVARSERVFIHGDFDVDGLTGAAVLYRAIRPLLPKNSVKVDVGDRRRGHGLSKPFVLRAIDEQFSLVITVDCGIGNKEEIEQLKQAGIDTIITDHHLPIGSLPNALAIIDPHQPGDGYPNKHLAGVGVAFKLVCGLYERLEKPMPVHLLDLVALGTIADMVPLSHDGESENRALVREAFLLIAKGAGSSLGLRVLLETLSVNSKKISAMDIGYLVAPKLNAANRAGDPKVAFLLLITEASDQAEYLAEILIDYNKDREIAQSDLIAQAEEKIREKGLNPRESGLVFLMGEYWNEGILGLVASNLADRFGVPAIVLSHGDRVSRGSCRSVGSFDISACLREHEGLLLQFGGHRMAAGFAIANENLPEFEEQLMRYAQEHRADMEIQAVSTIDTRLRLQDIDLRLFTNLTSLGPYGQGNREPHFLIEDCTFADLTLVGNRRQHLKGRVTQDGHSASFIAFRMAKYLEEFEQAENGSLVCHVGFDDWRNDVQIRGLDLVAE
ncbi:single-stranded-DNA-specific exonuclease RecJ [Candidatus Bipolaricaulota bacterium]|nr:single-stranded-DNA-specific exonuclease RecJ [Candidatus Bipolaricaulota bacterium]